MRRPPPQSMGREDGRRGKLLPEGQELNSALPSQRLSGPALARCWSASGPLFVSQRARLAVLSARHTHFATSYPLARVCAGRRPD